MFILFCNQEDEHALQLPEGKSLSWTAAFALDIAVHVCLNPSAQCRISAIAPYVPAAFSILGTSEQLQPWAYTRSAGNANPP